MTTFDQKQLKYELKNKGQGWPRRHEFDSMENRTHLGMVGKGQPLFEAKFIVYKDEHDEYGDKYIAYFSTPSILEQSTLIAQQLKVKEEDVLFTRFGSSAPVSATAHWWVTHYGEDMYTSN